MSNHFQVVGDIVAGTAVLGSLAGYLPEVAAGMAIIYYLFQFYRWLKITRHDEPRESTHHRERHRRRHEP